ncbi:substrate-binding domain-containing protein [Methylocaldum sp.]|uniref:substrate-binding domain-containing protein n=1 Tax=Methylocaldum sp. TaxID=1969727 RepID=UPI002D4D759E|nr:substrate-binding domain-containing protein [Methylocaldum sp.]HYE34090.1 substrate-binding domain-containing protein [Methylocaldum sp.]
MFSRCRRSGFFSVLALLWAFWPAAAIAAVNDDLPKRALRICSDPNNLPFSNQKQEGFENKIGNLIAHDLNAEVKYTWWVQRRGFIRNTLKSHQCDVVLGVPSDFAPTLTTTPYYRSSYVFVYRRDSGLNIRSFNDPALHDVRIGVQIVGDDFANTPPAHALTSRKIINNVVGYTVYGDYSQENPPARIIDAVVAGDIDIAIVWGPLAGYFAKRQAVPLAVVPVSPSADRSLPFVFDIAMGVRHGDKRLRRELERVIERRSKEIEAILDDYGVPRIGTRLSSRKGRSEWKSSISSRH